MARDQGQVDMGSTDLVLSGFGSWRGGMRGGVRVRLRLSDELPTNGRATSYSLIRDMVCDDLFRLRVGSGCSPTWACRLCYRLVILRWTDAKYIGMVCLFTCLRYAERANSAYTVIHSMCTDG